MQRLPEWTIEDAQNQQEPAHNQQVSANPTRIATRGELTPGNAPPTAASLLELVASLPPNEFRLFIQGLQDQRFASPGVPAAANSTTD